MSYRRVVAVAMLFLCIPALVDRPEGSACGPFLPEAQFGFERRPGGEFLRGELGIVKPHYMRRYLVVAYRYLSGAPLTAEEVEALSPKPAVQAGQHPAIQQLGPDAARHWLTVRNAVPAVQAVRNIEIYRLGRDYMSYQNCLDDAFETAAVTLSDRIARWGASSSQTAEWVRGQDQVFANCVGPPPPGMPVTPEAAAQAKPKIPEALPAGSDPLLTADRQYQIAAAAFYSGQWDAAEAGFRTVGANTQSPWRDSARYLIARTLIRQATIADRREALAAAEKTLRDILADPAQARWKEPADRLLGLVRAKLYPQERMAELSAALSKPGLGKAIAQAMVDFTTLWDHENKGPVEQSDLADWITAFQQGNTARAIERWRRGESPAWLVAALASVKPGDPAAADLVEAGQKVGPEHPAYATVAYHGIALQIARGERDPAREWADRALAAKLPVSVQNAIRGQRMTLAHDWTDYLRHASRMPVAVTAVEVDERLEDYSEAAPARPIFDRDFTEALNQHVPLALWVDGGASPLLPRELQLRIAQAGWVRAALLGRTGEARALGRRVAELYPELAEAMRDYAARQGADDAKFTAVFWILRTPGLGPEVRDGLGRLTETRKIDNYRDNWWRLPKPKDSKTATPPAPSAPIPPDVPEHPVDPPAFLAQDQRTAGDKEWLELRAAAHTAPNYLCAQTLVWAAAHPDDPRVPEALHLSVRATRYSLTDAATSDYSRKAFQLLHARYPQTRWAQQTKYWY